MVKVSVEVADGASHFRVSVRAENIQRAQAIAANCYPGCRTRVVFPIEPEGFFTGSQVGSGLFLDESPPAA